MTVKRFINHVYYSYASVDRLLTYNPVSIEARENAVYTATMTLSIALSGYILGMLYVICLLLIQISDLSWNRNMLFVIAIISALVLSFCLRTVKSDVYKKYFREFRNNPHYNHILWHIISFLFFAIGISIDLLILI
jgi:hypothetical protein